jgi:hypothetical protein
MEVEVPVGWEQDSHTLYLHSSGVRIERRIYKNKEGWVLVPVDLDRAVLEFNPNSVGLEQAFAAFAGGALAPKGASATPQVLENRKAARLDEKPDEPAEDEDDDES